MGKQKISNKKETKEFSFLFFKPFVIPAPVALSFRAANNTLSIRHSIKGKKRQFKKIRHWEPQDQNGKMRILTTPPGKHFRGGFQG